MTHTCQICAREIKAKNGVIAHHGYKRTHEGWQTRSCFGARYRPYERAHDALDRYIPVLEDLLARTLARLDELIAAPPEALTRTRNNGWDKKTVIATYLRPDGFEPIKHANRGSYNPSSYDGQFSSRCSALKREIHYINADLTESRARLAAWRLQ